MCQGKGLAWPLRRDGSHLPTLGDDDWQFGFVVGARGNVLSGVLRIHRKSYNEMNTRTLMFPVKKKVQLN